MPFGSCILKARFDDAEKVELEWNISHGIVPALSEDGQFLTYGLYPQTVVSDPSLISSLDATATLGSNGWYVKDGDYYTKENACPYGSPSYTFGNGETIADGAAYCWFKCEPIKWRVLQNSNGEAFVVSESILNAQRYDDSSNNYADSEIREWLHSNFFIRAFALGSSSVLTSDVDNSAASTGFSTNMYACENTADKVFLLSRSEIINPDYGFSSDIYADDSRIAKPTDYALAKGAYQYQGAGWWWLRSPLGGHSEYASYVHDDGSDTGCEVYRANRGVRPAMRIKL